MSYILDALRRAEAERQRGAVPGLHAQAAPVPAAALESARRTLALPWMLAGAALAVGLGAAAWWFARGATTEPSAAVAIARPAVVGSPASAVAAPPAAPEPSIARALPPPAPPPMPATESPIARPPKPVESSPAALASTAPPQAAPPSPAQALPPAPTPAPPRAATMASSVPFPPSPSPASAPRLAVAEAAAEAAPAASRVLPWAELPEPLRRQLPALALGGGMYSDHPAQRLVLVNGQVAREGEPITPELRLLRILPRSVVFGFRGQSFEMPL